MNLSMLIRSSLILCIALLLHVLSNFNTLAPNLVMYPIILAISPYMVSKLPLLGTKSLMETGIQPLFSLLLISGFAVFGTILVDFIKNSENNKIGIFLQSLKPVNVGPVQIQPEFVIVSVLTLFLELLFQEMYFKKKVRDEKKQLETVLERVLAKFTTCKIVNKNKQ